MGNLGYCDTQFQNISFPKIVEEQPLDVPSSFSCILGCCIQIVLKDWGCLSALSLFLGGLA